MFGAAAPTVVDDGFGSNGVVVPGDEFGSMKLLGSILPFAIGEDKARLILGY